MTIDTHADAPKTVHPEELYGYHTDVHCSCGNWSGIHSSCLYTFQQAADEGLEDTIKWHLPRKPPAKLSELIDWAIADALRLKNPTVCIDDACEKPDATTIPYEAYGRALQAFESAREGHWTKAFWYLHGSHPADEPRKALNTLPRPCHPVFNNQEQFDAHITSLSDCANKLRELDL